MNWGPVKIFAAGGFIGLLGLISYLVSAYLPIPPGMESIKFVGAVSAMAGGGIAMKLKTSKETRVHFTVLLALVIFIIFLFFYQIVAYGTPGATAVLFLYFCAAGIFAPFGFIASFYGVKLIDASDDASD